MKIEISNTIMKIGLAIMAGLLIFAVIFGAIKKASYDSQLLSMANAVAARDQTIEVQKGVYDKLAIQKDDLEGFLRSRDAEIVTLRTTLEKTNQQLLTANKMIVQWKKAYQDLVAASQEVIPPTTPGGPERIQVKFAKDWGYIGVEGWTKTNPAEAWVSVKQNKPLRIALVVSQDEAKVWHSYATSSEENVGINIELSAVNPWLTKPKWYEKLAINTFLGIGKDLGNTGNLTGILGIGATVAINQFDIGPFVGIHLGNTLDPMAGLAFSWHPFSQ